jgi:hypothetical protein
MSIIKPKRREFLQWSATSAAALSVGGLLQGCSYGEPTESSTERELALGIIRERKSWHKLNATEKGLYRRAVQLLTQEKIAGQEYANTYQRLAWVHDKSCPHGNWFFLPWHRVYTAHYECELIRVLSADPVTQAAAAKNQLFKFALDNFALPYWDWTVNPALPTEFIGKAADGSSLDPKFLHEQFEDFSEARSMLTFDNSANGPVGRATIDRAMAITDFYGFGSFPSVGTNGPSDRRSQGLLEQSPHNHIHATMGGIMGSFLSPMDPIFWLHHCNVDRLWSMWMNKRLELKQNPMPYDPKVKVADLASPSPGSITVAGINTDYLEYWKSFPIILKADDGGKDIVQSGNKPGDCIDSKTFTIKNAFSKGVIYDSDPRPLPVPRAMASISKTVTRYSLNSILTVSSDNTISAKIDVAQAQAVIAAFKASSDPWATMTLVLENIPIPGDPLLPEDLTLSQATKVTVRIADADIRAPSVARRKELGQINFLAHGAHHIGASNDTLSAALDVTDFFKTPLPTTGSVWVSAEFGFKGNTPEPPGWAAFRQRLPALLAAARGRLNVVLIAAFA